MSQILQMVLAQLCWALLSTVVLFTDEVKFTREGVANFWNSHVSADENLCAMCPHGFQQCYGFNMWADVLFGHTFFHLKSPVMRTWIFLNMYCIGSWKMSLHVRQNVWFLHDGAPSHFSCHLDQRFGQTWIGRGLIAWPARSPTLILLDYFLWSHMKSFVYETHVNSEENLMEWGCGCSRCWTTRYWWSCVQERGM